MKIVFTFLVAFCFLLLKGQSPAFAQTLQNVEPYAAAQHLQKAAHTDYTNLDFSILQKINNADKLEDFYNIENEDDDVSTLGRFLPLVIALVYVSLTFYLFDTVKHRLPFCKHLSYIASSTYLRQRVLRI
ncbi:hypothetical protein [Pedobacter sp. UC225_65]|uniref:hypothetical protein n=1 Tax=Pedobacter sp. UC225_65 TaxID=3350173 RepID=UPI00366A85CB